MSELEAWVNKLGHMQPEEIRKLMQDESIRAARFMPSRCAIAVFLKRKLGADFSSIAVGYSIGINVGRDHMRTPESVMNFMGNFDTGNYPELIERKIGA